MSPRWIPDTLGAAIYGVIHEGKLSPKELAAAVDCRHGYLLDAANQNREDTQLQARLIAPLSLASGNDAILRYLCHKAGGVFVRIDYGTRTDAKLADCLKETGELVNVTVDGEVDGQWSAAEQAALDAQTNKLIAAAVAHCESKRVLVGRVVEVGVRRPA